MNANLASVAAVPATMTELLQMAIEDGRALDRSIYHPALQPLVPDNWWPVFCLCCWCRAGIQAVIFSIGRRN